MTAERTEEQLMADYVGGDRLAFDKLFAVLAPRVHGFFLRKFANAVIADDLLQITFLKIHRARATYRLGAPVRPWVFTIAARVRLDELRKRGRSREDAASMVVEDATESVSRRTMAGPEEIEKADLIAKVREAIELLPESQREVVQLHRYEGLTFDEIAKVLDTTEGAAKLRAFRAYERLRKHLAPVLQEERK
jgi:RNA polymerase sigma-70 factor, ECF subfamily